MLPNLLIVVVPKAGTTSFFSYLNLHPDVFGSKPKEPGYFHPLRWGNELSDIKEYEPCFLGYSKQKVAISFDNFFAGLWHFLPFLKIPLSATYNFFISKPHNVVLSELTIKELEEFYRNDIAKTRSLLEQKQISNFPEWDE